MTALLNAVSALLVVAAIWTVIASARKAKSIGHRAAQLERIESELVRALRQLDSAEAADIWVGIHTIAMIRDGEAAVVALPKLRELCANSDPQIARQARLTAQRLEDRLRRVPP